MIKIWVELIYANKKWINFKITLKLNDPVKIFMSIDLSFALMPFFLDINVEFILYLGLNWWSSKRHHEKRKVNFLKNDNANVVRLYLVMIFKVLCSILFSCSYNYIYTLPSYIKSNNKNWTATRFCIFFISSFKLWSCIFSHT